MGNLHLTAKIYFFAPLPTSTKLPEPSICPKRTPRWFFGGSQLPALIMAIGPPAIGATFLTLPCLVGRVPNPTTIDHSEKLVPLF